MKTPGYDSPMLREQLHDTELMEMTEIGQDAVYNLICAREERKAQLHKLYLMEMEIFKKAIAFVFYLVLLFIAIMLGWMFSDLLRTLAACAALTAFFSFLRVLLNKKRPTKPTKT